MLDYKRIFEELLDVKLSDRREQRVLCPLHPDKNPSLNLNIEKGIWYCFACNRGGNIYQLAFELGYSIDENGFLTPLQAQQTNSKVVAMPKKQSQPKPQPQHTKIIPKSAYSLETYAEEKNLPVEYLTNTFKLATDENKGCLVIPYYDEDGELLFKKYRNGRKMWYDKYDKGAKKLQLYGLWLLDNYDTEYIYIVEGESDTQTLVYNDIPAIGIPGASAINDEMLEKIEHFKTWIFVMEYDEGGKTFISNAFKIINMLFPYKIADTYVMLMSDIEQKDINEIWKIAKKKERFLKIFNNISSIRVNIRVAYENYIKGGKTKMFDENIRVIAKDLYSKLHCVYDSENILWNYNKHKKVYEIVKSEDDFFRNLIIDYGINKTTKINQIANQLKTFISHQLLTNNIDMSWIHFKNVSINYLTLEKKEFEPEKYFIKSRIPYNFKENFKTNEKVENLFSTWVDEPEMLYKLIGYTFIQGYPGNKIFILYGIGGNGKSTFLELLDRILNGVNGEFNQTSSVNLDALIEDKFAASLLYGKLANLTGEMPYNKLTDTTRLKDLSGDQKIQAQFKFGKQFEFHNYAKLIFATNKIPATTDTSRGWFRRLVIINFKEIPTNLQDPHVLDKLTQEDYDYIVSKSLLALHKLATEENYEFMNINEVKRIYSDLSNPLRYFITSNCEITRDVNDWVESSMLIDKFKRWLQETGQPTMSWKEISAELTDMGLEKGRERNFTGSRVSVIYGIRWKNSEEENKDELPF